MLSRFALTVAAVATVAAEAPACTGPCRVPENMPIEGSLMTQYKSMEAKQKHWDAHAEIFGNPKRDRLSDVPCVNGMAGEYPCNNIDLLSFIPKQQLRPRNHNNPDGNLNDIWGWTDPQTGREYAIVCLTDGTTMVDVTDPKKPLVLGWLEGTGNLATSWRDAKVWDHYVFIGSEATNHGMQIFDLHELRGLNENQDRRFSNSAFYAEFGSSHNIVLNEETAVVYAVGTRTCRVPGQAAGGLHMVDVKDPLNPKFLGCFGEDGYTHDAECVNYNGPDERFRDREICFNYNENSLTLVDVTDKSDLKMLSREPYSGSQYTHQGWLTEDHRYLLMNDELDEQRSSGPCGSKTRTMVWNVEDLTRPVLHNSFCSSEDAIDHNLYIRNKIGYLSNYCAGLRVMDTSDVTANNGALREIGFFDVAPDCSTTVFSGTWSNYPYYTREGKVAVSSIERGLFMVDFKAL